ncbi:MAG: carboxyltransferase domain-containing protein, partial [Pseudomonadota bacterium]
DQEVELEIQYGGAAGPDLAAICRAMGLTETAFIDLHTGQTHRVDMIGFTPGFSYISGLPAQFDVPRRGDPRPRVPAGAVGISSRYTGVYALAGPGGWPLIGQVHDQLFTPEAEQPFKLQPGYRVQFKAV